MCLNLFYYKRTGARRGSVEDYWWGWAAGRDDEGNIKKYIKYRIKCVVKTVILVLLVYSVRNVVDCSTHEKHVLII